jgi:hypothetical protein
MDFIRETLDFYKENIIEAGLLISAIVLSIIFFPMRKKILALSKNAETSVQKSTSASGALVKVYMNELETNESQSKDIWIFTEKFTAEMRFKTLVINNVVNNGARYKYRTTISSRILDVVECFKEFTSISDEELSNHNDIEQAIKLLQSNKDFEFFWKGIDLSLIAESKEVPKFKMITYLRDMNLIYFTFEDADKTEQVYEPKGEYKNIFIAFLIDEDYESMYKTYDAIKNGEPRVAI